MTVPTSSLIIATYNQPDILQLSLQSIMEQTVMPDEIIIADDGSGEKTAEAVRSFVKQSSVPILHIWQPDDGFRVNMSRNNGVAASTGEYLIFLDGDCYLNKYFIEDHLSFAKPNQYVVGRRVNINQKRQEYVLRTGDRSISFFSWGTRKKFHAIRSRFLAMLHFHGGMASANFACWRSDYEKVNGFNERFTGFSGEDIDIARRFDAVGLVRRKMVHLGIAYHFDHPLGNRKHWKQGMETTELFQLIGKEEPLRCNTGLNRALEEGVTILNQ